MSYKVTSNLKHDNLEFKKDQVVTGNEIDEETLKSLIADGVLVDATEEDIVETQPDEEVSQEGQAPLEDLNEVESSPAVETQPELPPTPPSDPTVAQIQQDLENLQ